MVKSSIHSESQTSAAAASNACQANPEQAMAAILDALRQGDRFLICSHSRPDGDAVGSMLAMGMMLERMGKHADLVTADGVPLIYRRLPRASTIRHTQRVQGIYDAVILLECDGLERAGLRGLENYVQINIDHHLSGRPYARLNWIDCHAASVGELVYRLIHAAGIPLDADLATCLYTTVLTDTGGFTYGSVTASTFSMAHELVAAGADPVGIARDVCYSATTSKALLLGAALSNLKRTGRVAWLWVTQKDMVRTCAAEEDCEGIVNVAVGIAGVEVAVFLRELPENRIRLSLRSKGRVNVAEIAGRFGGGGHGNAAGCTFDGTLQNALSRILADLRKSVSQMHSG